MTEHAPDRLWSSIDIPKTVAGVLAALSAAVIGSFLGVAGTLAGAAVASLIGSVGTEVYHRSINKGKKKLQGTFTTAPAAVGTPPVAASPTSAPPSSASSSSSSASPSPSSSSALFSSASSSSGAGLAQRIRWRRVALVAGALFVLAMGTLTVAELLSGRSIADVTGGGSGDRPSVVSLFGGSDKSDKSDETPAPSSSSPAGDGNATTAPTDSATTQPTEQPTTSPTTGPATEAPTGADSGNDPDSGGTDPGATNPKGAADPDSEGAGN